MKLTDKRTERVAKAICYTAKCHPDFCLMCDPDEKGLGPMACTMVEEFRAEAEAAIKAMKGY